MKRLYALLAACVMVVVAAAVQAQETYYVQSAKAKILSAPSFKAAVLGEASRGSKLSAARKEGNWIKLTIAGKDGYVSSLLVTPYPPMAKAGLIKAEDTEFQQSVRRRASTYTSAAAARGLAQDDRRRIGGEEKLDYDSLERVEKFTVSDDEVARFAEGGKP